MTTIINISDQDLFKLKEKEYFAPATPEDIRSSEEFIKFLEDILNNTNEVDGSEIDLYC